MKIFRQRKRDVILYKTIESISILIHGSEYFRQFQILISSDSSDVTLCNAIVFELMMIDISVEFCFGKERER